MSSIFDVAAILSLLGMAGIAGKWFFDNYAGNETKRESQLLEWENAARAAARDEIRDLRERMERIERSYGLVIGIAHVMIDELVGHDPNHIAFGTISARLREAYPVPTEMPPEIVALVARVEGRAARRKSPDGR